MIYKLIMLSEKQQIWGIWLCTKNLTHSKSMGILDYIKCRYSKNGFLEKIETWHVGLSCQYTHFMSFSSKSEHDTIADQATLTLKELGVAESAPLNIFCYISAGCYFVVLKLHDFFSLSPALNLKPFFKKSDRGL